MRNTKRLQAKMQHMALASIVVAGLVAPVVQLAPVLPGMSLQDVKAATGTVDPETPGQLEVTNARDTASGTLNGTTPAMLNGQDGTVDSSWKITPITDAQKANKFVNAKGDLFIQYASKKDSNSANTIYNGGQAKNDDSTAAGVNLVTPTVPQNTDTVPQIATYMAVTPGAADYGTTASPDYSRQFVIAAGSKAQTSGSGNLAPKPYPNVDSLYRFTGPQTIYLHDPADTSGTKLLNPAPYMSAADYRLVVTFANGQQSDASMIPSYTSKYGTYTGPLRYYTFNPKTGQVMVQTGRETGKSSNGYTTYYEWDKTPHVASSDADWTDSTGKYPVTTLFVNALKTQGQLNWQMVLTGNVKMPTNGDTTKFSGDSRMFAAGGTGNGLNYDYTNDNVVNGAIGNTLVSRTYKSSYEEGGFNLLKNVTVDHGAVTNTVSYTDTTGKTVASDGSYAGGQLVENDKIVNKQNSDITGNYTITTGSQAVTFASAPTPVNAAGQNVSDAVKMGTVTYTKDDGTPTTDPTQATKATFALTAPKAASFTLKTVFKGNDVATGVVSKTDFVAKDANGGQVDLAGNITWNANNLVSGDIKYVDANKNVITTGAYANKKPGSATADITTAPTVDGMRYRLVSVDTPTYDGTTVQVTVAPIVSGHIDYVDLDGSVIPSKTFTDVMPGSDISTADLAVPTGYVLAPDEPASYKYPTQDNQVVTVKVQKLNVPADPDKHTPERVNGMELTKVPSFTGSGKLGFGLTTDLTANDSTDNLSYLNLTGNKADIYMAASDLKSTIGMLPVQSLTATIGSQDANVYVPDGQAGYGQKIVNGTTLKKGSMAIPGLKLTLANGNFAAGVYSGTIKYTIVEQDLSN